VNPSFFNPSSLALPLIMTQKVVVVGAGPVGSLAALYAAVRGYEVDVYELRAGKT
jgi:NADPH-dependent 2,4-dienoyl-CoA reductase/sulfur reductase-like enzyme